METPRVLVVDDEESIRHILRRVLEMNGCDVREAESAEEATKLLESWEPAVGLFDIVLPGKNGIQLLSEIKQLYPDTEIIVMTSNASAETALQAIRRGAYDYLQKPFENLAEVWTNVQRALEKRRLSLKNRELLQKRDERKRELSSAVSLPETGTGGTNFSSLSEILDNFLSVVTHELDVERASLMLLNKTTGELEIAASQGIPGEFADARIALGEGIAGRVAETGETFLVTDASSDHRVDCGDKKNLSNSFISAPIVFSVAIKAERDVIGVINVTNRRSDEPFNAADAAFLSGLAGQLGIVIDGARHSDELQLAYESLKTTQDQLVFSERIKAIGQMAAGVAHDFNNALSVIMVRAQFAIRRLKQERTDIDAACADLEIIVKTSLQGAEAIKRIQDYTRIRKDQPNSEVDLNTAVQDAVEIARPKWKQETEASGNQIDLQLELGNIPSVSGNVYELTQVVGNLIFNAVEAMPDGGTLTIRTRSESESVIVEVQDSGIGMNEETRKRLFEPFFTTKENGQGLGTSIIFGIVSRHGGQITVESVPGEGSTFRVELPVLQGVQEEVPEPTGTATDGPNVKARILLVDDDELVRETNAEVLATGGHEVVAVADGRQALARCGDSSFDLIITDLSMPGMSGLELATEVRQRGLDIPVVLFSGWAIQEQEEKVKEAGIDHILVKPCLMEVLLDTVQTVLRTPVDA